MLRGLAFLLFVASLVLVALALWQRVGPERKKSVGIGLLAGFLVLAGALMIAVGD